MLLELLVFYPQIHGNQHKHAKRKKNTKTEKTRDLWKTSFYSNTDINVSVITLVSNDYVCSTSLRLLCCLILEYGRPLNIDPPPVALGDHCMCTHIHAHTHLQTTEWEPACCQLMNTGKEILQNNFTIVLRHKYTWQYDAVYVCLFFYE